MVILDDDSPGFRKFSAKVVKNKRNAKQKTFFCFHYRGASCMASLICGVCRCITATDKKRLACLLGSLFIRNFVT